MMGIVDDLSAIQMRLAQVFDRCLKWGNKLMRYELAWCVAMALECM